MGSMYWPPEYTITISQKAKHVYLKISPERGLICVIPKQYDQTQLPTLLEQKKTWIEKHLKKVASRKKNKLTLPDNIQLPTVDHYWRVDYIPLAAKLQLLEIGKNQLTIYGKIDNKKACQQLLISWLKVKAKTILNNELRKLANTTKLNYHALNVRDQKTRWGSCSAEKNISLNYKLIFLPSELMQHILLHELCHTKYLNHSKQFWLLLSQHDANYVAHNRQLKAADKFIPEWILA